MSLNVDGFRHLMSSTRGHFPICNNSSFHVLLDFVGSPKLAIPELSMEFLVPTSPNIYSTPTSSLFPFLSKFQRLLGSSLVVMRIVTPLFCLH